MTVGTGKSMGKHFVCLENKDVASRSFSIRVLTFWNNSYIIAHDCFVKCANGITYAALFDFLWFVLL